MKIGGPQGNFPEYHFRVEQNLDIHMSVELPREGGHESACKIDPAEALVKAALHNTTDLPIKDVHNLATAYYLELLRKLQEKK